MSKIAVTQGQSAQSRIFRLDGFPSVRHPSQGVQSYTNNHEANRGNSPAIAAIFVRFLGKIASVDLVAVGDDKSSLKTDMIQVTLKDGNQWDQSVPTEDVIEILNERLNSNLGIVITPDLREAHQISTQEMRDAVKRIRPQNVVKHNGQDKADNAITIPDDGWNPKTKTLRILLGEKCATMDESVCSDINQKVTVDTLSKHLRVRFPGLKVV